MKLDENGAIERNQVIQGDCLEILREFPDNTFSAILTDPPYGLSDHSDIQEILKAWINGEVYHHNKKGFMGSDWDGNVPGPEVWKEVLRVLKPGGHILSCSGTRSYDLMTMAIRLAGAEIRDKMAFFTEIQENFNWVQGQGFPKSLSISKAIDAKIITGGSHSSNIKKVILERPGESRKTSTLPNNGVMSEYRRGGITNDNASTEQAKQFNGYGTALKPAHEPIISVGKSTEEIRSEALQTDVPFLYTAKVSTKERNYGCKNLFWKYDNDGFIMIGEEEYNSLMAENEKRKEEEGFELHRISQGNIHPTCKPIELMRYLSRMCKQPNDNLVLDPFCGSGSTGIGCILEGCDYIMIEREPNFCKIAEARLNYFRCLGKSGLK